MTDTSTVITSPLTLLQASLKEDEGKPKTDEMSMDLHSINNALSAVINFILTDAFNLTEEENMWVSYHLNTILEPVSVLRPRVLLAAVKRELDNKEYSDKLFRRDWASAGYIDPEADVRYAPLEDWVEALSEIVLVSYPDLRPLLRSSIIGSIHGVMTELGVSEDLTVSRGSVYLPTAIRHLVGLA